MYWTDMPEEVHGSLNTIANSLGADYTLASIYAEIRKLKQRESLLVPFIKSRSAEFTHLINMLDQLEPKR